MNRIAVVCAWNPRNAGMYSVDLAALTVLEACGLKADHLLTQTRRHSVRRLGKLKHRLVRTPEELAKYDLVLYWGDFLNNADYGLRDFANRDVKRYGCSLEDAFERWKSMFLLSDASLDHVRAISVSNNFAALPQALGSLPEEDRDTLRRIYSHRFQAIFPRDPASLAALRSQQSPDATTLTGQGIDAAFLLNQPISGHDGTARHFVSFFGRSLKQHGDEIVTVVAKATGMENRALGPWFSLPKPLTHFFFTRMLRAMRNSAFVLTDTYHVAVNAIASGVPVVVAGIHTDAQVGTLGDYKKQQLLGMFGLDDQYVTLTTPQSIAESGPAFLQAAERARAGRHAATERLQDMRSDYVALLKRTIGG